MKAIFFGYNILGGVGLEALLRHGFDVVAVVTHEDDPNENIYFESVAEKARSKGIKVFTPENPNTPEFVETLKSLSPDIIFSFYYRLMIKRKIRDLVNGNAYNLHGSLLPKYRGRCPVNWAFVHGEKKMGVTLHKMVRKADRGDIVDQQGFDVIDCDNASTVQPKMERSAIVLLNRALPLILRDEQILTPQNEEEATYFGGRRPDDGIIDWNSSAENIHNLIRAVTDPFPGAITHFGDHKLILWTTSKVDLKVSNIRPGTVISTEPFVIATGDGGIEIISTQVNEFKIDGHLISSHLDIEAGSILG